MLRLFAYTIAVFISFQVSVARVQPNYDQLYSLTDDAPRGEIVNERYNLPEDDMAENEEEETLDFDIRERSCVLSRKTIPVNCSGSKYRIVTVECRPDSLLSCHSSIPIFGSLKCKEVVSFIPRCGRAFTTGCECAASE